MIAKAFCIENLFNHKSQIETEENMRVFIRILTIGVFSSGLLACGRGFESTKVDIDSKAASPQTATSNPPGSTLPPPSPEPAPTPAPPVVSNPPPAPMPAPQPAPGPAPSASVTQVLTLANPNLIVQAGQTITLTTRFHAVPMNKDYAVFIHFIDPNGVQQSSFNGDYTPSVSTRQWSGLVSYNRSLTIPTQVPIGRYTVKLGLFENVPPYNNRPQLGLGGGVTQDEQIRYIVGSLTITAPPPPPDTIPKPGSLGNLTPSGPITLESNRTYSNLKISNPGGRCIYGYKVTNVRITNSEIGPCGNGTSEEHSGIFVHTSSNIRIDHNVIHSVASGVVAVSSTNVITSHNHISSIRGPFPAGQIVMYDKMHGAGNKILCNIGDNRESDNTEDSINTWMSHGVPESFIEVAYNRIRGGHSKSGTGINIGDGGSSYVDVHDNTVVNVNNAGIGISSGHNILLRNNRVYNNGTYTSVGMSVRNWYSGCQQIQVSNNRVWAFDRVWGMNSVWHYLNTGECSAVTETGNIFGDTTLSAAIFDEPYPQCN